MSQAGILQNRQQKRPAGQRSERDAKERQIWLPQVGEGRLNEGHEGPSGEAIWRGKRLQSGSGQRVGGKILEAVFKTQWQISFWGECKRQFSFPPAVGDTAFLTSPKMAPYHYFDPCQFGKWKMESQAVFFSDYLSFWKEFPAFIGHLYFIYETFCSQYLLNRVQFF